MFSLQRALGEDDRLLDLLDASAGEACQSVAALKILLEDQSKPPTLEAFEQTRRKDKELMDRLSDLMIRALVVATEREDIEALADSLYKIPKTVEKFAERYIISARQIGDIDFSRQVNLMDRGCTTARQMIRGLREGDSVAELKQLNANMQKIESDADELMLELIAPLYQSDFPKLKALIAKDLFELNEKVVDRCRDAGSVIVRVALKNS